MNFFFSSRRRHTFFFQAEDGIRDRSPSRGLGDVYKRQIFYLSSSLEEPLWFYPQPSPPDTFLLLISHHFDPLIFDLYSLIFEYLSFLHIAYPILGKKKKKERNTHTRVIWYVDSLLISNLFITLVPTRSHSFMTSCIVWMLFPLWFAWSDH